MTHGSRILGLCLRVASVGLFSFLVLALFFEFYLRWSGFLSAQPANYPCITGDPVLNHVFQKACEGEAKAEDLKVERTVTYKTNRLGYRGHEPIPGRQTLVVIGDSYTEGFGLSEADAFPATLERALEGIGKGNWQVLNGGTMGFSAALYPRYFERYFLGNRPQLVLLNLDVTDFTDDPYFLEIADFDGAGEPVAFPGREILPSWILPYVYSNRSALLRFLHQEANQWHLVRRRGDQQPIMDQWISGMESWITDKNLQELGLEGCAKSIRATAKSVLKLRRIVESGGGRLALHMYPPGHLIKSYSDQPQSISFVRLWDQKARKDYSWACGINPKVVDVMKVFSGKVGILLYDSFPLVMGRADRKSLYFEHDAHWNEAGVRLVANDLAKRMLPLLTIAEKKRERK